MTLGNSESVLMTLDIGENDMRRRLKNLIASALLVEKKIAVGVEREACAKIASDRAAICQASYDAGDKTEVHPLNEALHIAQLIRNRER